MADEFDSLKQPQNRKAAPRPTRSSKDDLSTVAPPKPNLALPIGLGAAVILVIGVVVVGPNLAPKGETATSTGGTPPVVGSDSQPDPLEQAKLLADAGQLTEAVKLAKQVPANSPDYDQAKTLADSWSKQAKLAEAKAQAEARAAARPAPLLRNRRQPPPL